MVLKQRKSRIFFRGALAALTAAMILAATPISAHAAAVTDDKSSERIEQLEFALIAKTPDQAAEDWAESLENRNGAQRYSLLSDALREKYKKDYVDCNWVIGGSSPWVESDQVVFCGNSGTDIYHYEIDYVLTDSTGLKEAGEETITVQKTFFHESDSYCWCVTDGSNLDASWDLALKP